MPVYRVQLQTTSVQTKYIQANSIDQANAIAENLSMEWNEKEEVLDTELHLTVADESEYENRNIWTEEDINE